jgi:cobalt-zinc-cadmium efflux system membrane fusion protein
MKTNFVFAIVLLVSFVGFNGCTGSEAHPDDINKKFTLTDSSFASIELTDVDMTDLTNEVRLTGKIIADENNIVSIFPLVGGQVTYVNAELGDLVSTSQTLAILKSGEVAEFEKEQINAKAAYEVAKKNLLIEEELFASKFSSERELISAKKAFEETEAELKKINEVLRVYNINSKGEYIVKSPVAGFIIEKKIGPDVQIRSDMMDNIFKVARLDEVFVSMNIYESDIAKIKVGMEAEIHVFSYEDTVYYGKIDRIINVLDPDSKTIEARVRLQNPGFKLKPDMNCSVVLKFAEDEKMISVPSSAVVFDKNKYFVTIYRSHSDLETREVQVHRDINGTSYISIGLKQGEKVISKNALFIYDAMND